ncbi:MAG: hypothetical protein Q7K42_06355, partial [Candidatus Diapherotrites archaeon]|nr:hypothetical protein [Candidatus Diapherotrites archaeon]
MKHMQNPIRFLILGIILLSLINFTSSVGVCNSDQFEINGSCENLSCAPNCNGETIQEKCFITGGSPECCNQIPFDIDSQACQNDLSKIENTQIPQFTYPEATEAYTLVKSCLDEKGYSATDNTCFEQLEETQTNISNEYNQCLSQCFTNKPESTNCDVCVKNYSSGGYTARTFSSCDSFCIEKSPGQCGECTTTYEEKNKEISSVKDLAIKNWQTKADAAKAIQDAKATEDAAKNTDEKATEKKENKPA